MLLAVSNVFVFLLRLVFEVYIFFLILRFLMEKLGAHYYNPVSQLVIKASDFWLSSLKKIIPMVRGFNVSLLIGAFVLELIKLYLLLIIQSHLLPAFQGVLFLSVAELGKAFVSLYFYAIIIRVIGSWFLAIQRATPLLEIVYLITDPMLRPFHRRIPTFAGVDFSPFLVLVVLQLISMLVLTPMVRFGTALIGAVVVKGVW